MENTVNLKIHERLLELVKLERRITSKILDLLQQIENHRSYLAWGYSSLFDYLVKGLGYSESLAYQRKTALKLCAVIPEVKEKLDQGSLSLTTLARANRVLSTKSIPEKRTLLLELENKKTQEIDKILARELPEFTKSPGPAKRYVNANTVRVTFDLSEEEYKNFEKLKALKSHQVKDLKELLNLLVNQELNKITKSRPAKINRPTKVAKATSVAGSAKKITNAIESGKITEAMGTAKITEKFEANNAARSDKNTEKFKTIESNNSTDGFEAALIPSKSTNPRQIKISLKKYLFKKANYKCQYPGCDQDHFLQTDHIKSVSRGGTNAAFNLQVLCQAHNQFKYLSDPEK